MAVSEAKKMRLKRIRENKSNPELQRRTWDGVNPIHKTTPSLTERTKKLNNKHKKWNLSQDESNGSIFYGLIHSKNIVF